MCVCTNVCPTLAAIQQKEQQEANAATQRKKDQVAANPLATKVWMFVVLYGCCDDIISDGAKYWLYAISMDVCMCVDWLE